MSIAKKLQTIAENEQRVYEAGEAKGIEEGKQAEYDRFWDEYQNFGKRTAYGSAFYNKGWTDVSYNPKYDIVPTSAVNTFAYSPITDTKVNIDVSKATTTNIFNYCGVLKTIRNLIVSENTDWGGNCFAHCSALENLTITGTIGKGGLDLHWSTKLTKASITSVINALSTTTSGLTVTISKVAKEAAFTDAEWADLIATKPNWTYSLV